jgi:hypothetical protein
MCREYQPAAQPRVQVGAKTLACAAGWFHSLSMRTFWGCLHHVGIGRVSVVRADWTGLTCSRHAATMNRDNEELSAVSDQLSARRNVRGEKLNAEC